MLEDADLLAASARQSFMLRRSIGLAADPTELQKVGQRVTDLASGAVPQRHEGIRARAAILSVVIDSVVRRALELALAETQAGPPPAGFAWLTLGSIARREAMPSSDVDSALSWRDELSSASGAIAGDRRPHPRNPRRVRVAVGHATGPSPRARSSPARSRSGPPPPRAGSTIRCAIAGLILSSLLLDGRVVWGDAALHTVPAAYRRMRDEHPNALRLQLLDALSGNASVPDRCATYCRAAAARSTSRATPSRRS